MTALTDKRAVKTRATTSAELPCTAETVYQGGVAGWDLSTGLIRKVPDGGDPNMVPVGLFVENKTYSSGDNALLRLFKELHTTWFVNSGGGDAITTAHRGRICYFVDDQTVALTDNGGTRSVAGRIWRVDSAKGVNVEVFGPGAPASAGGAAGSVGAFEFEFDTEADGTALADFADGASNTPGYDVTAGELAGIRWNNAAAPDPVASKTKLLPFDLDASQDITIKVLASKVGATVGDATTFDIAAFLVQAGDLHDADASAGGTSGAMTGDAPTKTVQEVELTIAAANIPNGVTMLTITVQPTDGTLGTDDVIVHSVRAEYSRR